LSGNTGILAPKATPDEIIMKLEEASAGYAPARIRQWHEGPAAYDPLPNSKISPTT
jgi:hypothetical protein